MYRKAFSVACIAGFLLFSNLNSAEKFEIDVSHSMIGFSVRHMAISNVKGNFKEFEGHLVFDENDLSNSSATVTIKSGSINTGNDRRDNHLRSEDFFDTEKYPEITFTSKSIEKTDAGYNLNGTLTMHGVSKDITIPFVVIGTIKDARGNTRIGLEGGFTLNRQDYGVSWSRVMDSGGFVVSDDVKIELNIEAISRKANN